MTGNFVQFRACGVIYERDNKTNKPVSVKKIIRGNGVVRSGPEMMGKIFRQCSDLLPCDWVTVDTYNI